MTPSQFEQVNGYSNQFWGWGGEDDDMGHRVKSKKFRITGYHDKFSRYLMKIPFEGVCAKKSQNYFLAWGLVPAGAGGCIDKCHIPKCSE